MDHGAAMGSLQGRTRQGGAAAGCRGWQRQGDIGLGRPNPRKFGGNLLDAAKCHPLTQSDKGSNKTMRVASRARLVRCVGAVLAVAWCHQRAAALTYTWDGGGTNNTFSNSGNWDPDTAGGVLNGHDFIFGPLISGGWTTANVDVTGNPSSFTFSANASAMTISGNALQFAASTATPIKNSSSNLQTFSNTARQFRIGGTTTRTWDAASGDLSFATVDLRGDSNGVPTAFTWA
jgi:hypothetical protein